MSARRRAGRIVSLNSAPRRQAQRIVKSACGYIAEALESRVLLALTVGPSLDISQMAGHESEGTIAIDPTQPSHMFVASNVGPDDSLFASYSTNSGTSWTNRLIATGPPELPQAWSDPSTSWDQFGNLFLTYLDHAKANIVVARSTDGGQTFSLIQIIPGDDQPTIATGPGNRAATGSVWVMWADAGDDLVATGAQVGGLGAAVALPAPTVIPGGHDCNFGDIAVGPGGKVMVTYQDNTGGQWQSQIFVNTDPDGVGGLNFGAQVLVTTTNVGGHDQLPAQFNRTVDAEAGLAWDSTGGAHNGRVYLLYTDEFIDESDDFDVLTRYSDDDGATWSAFKQVNDDNTASSQFLPRIAMDTTTGQIAVTWLDCRNDRFDGSAGDTDHSHLANDETEVFGTISTNGGLNFLPNVTISSGASESAASPNLNDFGDYTGLAFEGGSFYPIWADNSRELNGNPDLFRCDMATARVKVPATGTGVIIPNTSTLNLYGIGAIVKAGAEIQRLADLVDKIHDKLYSILDHKLPIVGGKLGQALNTGQDAFNKISSYLSTNLNSLGSLTQITGVDVQNVIWAALGTPGLDILPASVVSAADIPIVLKSTDGNNSDAEEVYLNLDAEGDVFSGSINPNFDIGLPGLGLSLTGAITAKLSYTAHLDLGLDDNGFFIDLSHTGSDPELGLSLSMTTPNFSAIGTLGFLQLASSDGTPAGNTNLTGTVGMDFTVGGDDKMRSIDLPFLSFSTDFDAAAQVHLHNVLSFGASADFPSLLADFDMSWQFLDASLNAGGSDLTFGDKPEIAFNNVQIDLGSFFSSFASPVVNKVKDVLAPFQPVVDFLRKRVPILDDFLRGTLDQDGDHKVTMLDVATILGNTTGNENAVHMLYAAVAIIDLVNDIPSTLNGTVLINLGRFEIGNDPRAFNTLSDAMKDHVHTEDVGAQLSSLPNHDATDQQHVNSFLNTLDDTNGNPSDNTNDHRLQFPILQNPLSAFDYLLGKEVKLVEYTMPDLSIHFGKNWDFPIIPPLDARLTADFTAHTHFKFGFDTYGIRQFATGGYTDPIKILDGLYVEDHPVGGADPAEITVDASFQAFAKLNGGVVAAGVGGGIFGHVSFDLDDPETAPPHEDDGKLRFSEIKEQFGRGPLCIFDTKGAITANLLAFVQVGVNVPYVGFVGWEKSWDLASTTLVDFHYSCPPVPPPHDPYLATVLPGRVLRLNMGPHAADRGSVDLVDGNERFILSPGANPGDVVVTSFNYSQTRNATQTYSDISKIYAEGGMGNDVVLCEPGLEIATEFYGGFDPVAHPTMSDPAGKDVLIGGDGPAMLDGNEADDQLTARIQTDPLLPPLNNPATLRGGSGNDILKGSDVADLLIGGDDTDPNDGCDRVYGNGGNDTIRGGPDNDVLQGGDGNDSISGGDGNDHLDGNAGNDTLLGNDGDDVIAGDNGSDSIEGGNGNDFLLGDTAVVGMNRVSISGDNSDPCVPPTLPGSIAFEPGDGASDFIIGGPGNDAMIGRGGGDEFIGGEGNDTISSQLAGDTVDGGLGNNTLVVSGNSVKAHFDVGANFISSGEGGKTSIDSFDGLYFDSGMFTVYQDLGGRDLTVDSLANATVNASQHLNELFIGDGGQVTLSASGDRFLRANSLAINGAGRLDLNNNDLILDYTGNSQSDVIQAMINSGRAGGAWTGNGITSSSARNSPRGNTSLGAMEATSFESVYGQSATFHGETLDPTMILVKYTYYGDTDFNGAVDGDDYARIDAAFANESTLGNIGGWFNGDFDGNGKVDGADYALIDAAFNSQGAPLRPLPGGRRLGGAVLR